MVDTPFDFQGMSAQQACARLEASGWRLVGVGDWSWVLADPSDDMAARVTPFDPGYKMFADACIAGPSNRWLPKMFAIFPLCRDGYVVLMERLWPAEDAAASAFCAALGIANDTGYPPPTAGPAVAASELDVIELRARIGELLAEGHAKYRLWAGSDIREENVMADRAGRLKLVDPVGIAGWKIVDALRNSRSDLLADFSPAQLEDFLDIPYFGPGREGHDERDEILGGIARLYGRSA